MLCNLLHFFASVQPMFSQEFAMHDGQTIPCNNTFNERCDHKKCSPDFRLIFWSSWFPSLVAVVAGPGPSVCPSLVLPYPGRDWRRIQTARWMLGSQKTSVLHTFHLEEENDLLIHLSYLDRRNKFIKCWTMNILRSQQRNIMCCYESDVDTIIVINDPQISSRMLPSLWTVQMNLPIKLTTHEQHWESIWGKHITKSQILIYFKKNTRHSWENTSCLKEESLIKQKRKEVTYITFT